MGRGRPGPNQYRADTGPKTTLSRVRGGYRHWWNEGGGGSLKVKNVVTEYIDVFMIELELSTT